MSDQAVLLQKRSPGQSFWPNTGLVTHILFELCLFWYLVQSTYFWDTLYVYDQNFGRINISIMPKLRPGICVKYFLSFPQKKKPVTRENWDKVSVYFLFLNNKIYNYTQKKSIWQLTIWQNLCFGQFHHSKIEK